MSDHNLSFTFGNIIHRIMATVFTPGALFNRLACVHRRVLTQAHAPAGSRQKTSQNQSEFLDDGLFRKERKIFPVAPFSHFILWHKKEAG